MSDPIDPIDPFEASERKVAAPTLSPDLEAALRAEYEAGESVYDGARLRVGTDLLPPSESCDRETVFRLNGVPRDRLPLRKLAMFREGKNEQARIARALRRAGEEIVEEVAVRPLRQSAWAWAEGHGDILRVKRRHLHEVKVTEGHRFEAALNDPSRLVSEAHMWQLSHYATELRRQGRVDSASWIYVDRSHLHDPVEVPLTDDLTVSLEEIIAVEAAKSTLIGLTLQSLPPRPAGRLVVEVLKGPAKKVPQRKVRATSERYSWCKWCPYLETCAPGPEETEITLTHGRQAFEIARAEQLWAKDPKAKAVFRYGPGNAEDVNSVVQLNSATIEVTDAAGETLTPTLAALSPGAAPTAPEAPPLPPIHPDPPTQAAAAGSSLSDPVEAKALVATPVSAESCAICSEDLTERPSASGGRIIRVRATLDGGETVCVGCWSHLPGVAAGRKHMPLDPAAFLSGLVAAGHAAVVQADVTPTDPRGW